MLEKGEIRNPVMIIVLTLVTCGLYSIYFYYVLIQDINKGLGRNAYNPIVEILLTLVTCGLWGYWLQWRLAVSVNEIENAWGVPIKMEAPILFLINIFLFGVMDQVALNDVWQNGTPPSQPLPLLTDNLDDNLYNPENDPEEQRYREELEEFDAQINNGDNTF